MKLRKYIGILSLCFSIFISLCSLQSCAKDEPRRAVGSEESAERDPGYHTGEENGKDDTTDNSDQEEDSLILGKWKNDSGTLLFTFASNGTFEGMADNTMGFHVSDTSNVSGIYTYDDVKTFLWLSVDGDHEIYVLEFRCIISDDTMTLYSLSGRKTVLKRAE